MQCWWVTANKFAEDHEWHWNSFFADPMSNHNSVWGCGEITEATSLVHIDEMEKWDIVVAYQATEKNIYGLAYLRRGGFRYRRKGEKDSFALGWADCDLTGKPFVRLNCCVPLSDIQSLYNSENSIEFVRKHMGTVFSMSLEGFKGIIAKMIRNNPEQADEINSFIKWVRNKGIVFDLEEIRKARRKMTGEVFTPTPLVADMLDELPGNVWEDPEKTFCDAACGSGNFLVECLRRKLSHGHDPLEALSTIYGVDLMPDNVRECQERLLALMPTATANEIEVVLTNIVCANSLEYDFDFDRKPTAEEIRAFGT